MHTLPADLVSETLAAVSHKDLSELLARGEVSDTELFLIPAIISSITTRCVKVIAATMSTGSYEPLELDLATRDAYTELFNRLADLDTKWRRVIGTLSELPPQRPATQVVSL